MSKSMEDPKICPEGRRDHKEDQNDFSIPLWLVGIILVALIASFRY